MPAKGDVGFRCTQHETEKNNAKKAGTELGIRYVRRGL